MSVVRVAIPLVKGKRRFFLAKGRPWSLVEHVFLAALAGKPRTVDDLAAAGNVPRRLVLEALIRLMRAGWVDLLQEPKGVVFSISKAGREVVDDEELPQVTRTMSRWMNFVIDRLTGTLYRSRELPFFERHVVQERAGRERLVWLRPREIDTFDDTTGVLAALFDPDEKFVGIEPSPEKMVERWAVATVRQGYVDGLPRRAPRELFDLVKAAAKSAPSQPIGQNSPYHDPGKAPAFVDRETPAAIDCLFRYNDLILGGNAHEEALLDAIKRCRQRLIIHSTFISAEAFSNTRPHLVEAVKRGAVVDVLWGEDDDKTGIVSTLTAVDEIRARIHADGLHGSFRVHRFSTRSHAKILCADDGKGRLSVIVGSCNWLSSGFRSYEASARFSDGRVVAAVLEQVADLTRGLDRHWTDLTSEVAQLADEVRGQRPPPGVKGKVTIVLGPQHARFARLARDSASKRMFVTSHRLGAATRPAVIVPAIAAVRDRGIEVKIYYGTQTKPVTTTKAAQLMAGAGEEGVALLPVIEPRLHAKMLAWDDDNLLVTSQNWLSADPSDSSLRREIGVLIQANGVARQAIDDFEATRRI